MKNLFVYGGCVSRDVFNPEYNEGKIALSNYIARYSIAKLQEKAVRLNFEDNKITSAFQKKLLLTESRNLLLTSIRSSNFDYLLMDIMYLRYRLVFYKNSWLTYSSELKKTGLIRSTHQVISSKDILFWDKVKVGLDLLFEELTNVGKLDNVLINKLYLSTHKENGERFDNQGYIAYQNSVLDKGYDLLSKYLKPSQFLNYEKSLFVSKIDHKWGLDPMHYIDDLYKTCYDKIVNYEIDLK